MLKRMRRIGIFFLAIAVVISCSIIASANERDGTDNSVDAQSTTSNYVIENKNRNNIKVTIEHYDNSTGKEIYAKDEINDLAYESKINDYAKALNWTVDHVMVNGQKSNTPKDILLDKDSTVKVYYNANKTSVDGPTTFYDYTVKAGEEKALNYRTNQWETKNSYSFNQLGDQPNSSNQKLTSGTSRNAWKGVYWNGSENIEYQKLDTLGANGNNYSSYSYEVMTNNYDANAWTGSSKVVTGLLNSVDLTTGKVNFNYPEPGFFVDEDASVTASITDPWTNKTENKTVNLRKVYKDFKLQFNKNGDTYTLNKAYKGKDSKGNDINFNSNDGKCGNAGSNFFPLDDYKSNDEKSENGHNYFFGMRYDVTFKIGDYIGPLNYSFTGDDDLWVVLDGNKVVIDLGGIHDAAKATTNLWEALGLTPGSLTEEQKNQEHTLTILYMERGAGKSNCQMNFTLPSARISEVTNVPMADLTFNKVNSKGVGISGAAFKLVNDNDSSEVYTASSYGADGTVEFDKLKVGTYTLTETMAPNGYVTSSDSWKVVVTESNGSVTVKLLNTDGSEVSNNQISNTANEEYLNSTLKVNKTAKVTDWDERKYEITLSASSYAQQEITPDPVDVVLVFDTSGSMKFRSSLQKYRNCEVNELSGKGPYYYVTGDSSATVYRVQKSGSNWYYQDDSHDGLGTKITSKSDKLKTGDSYQFYTTNDSKNRLEYLQQAATTFTTNLAAKSPNSKVSLVTFNATATKQFDLKNVGKNLDSINSTINNLDTAGGTRQDLGLEKATSILESSTRNKYVILLTDGCPNAKGNTDVMTYKAMIDKANDLKAKDNTTLMTVGVGLSADNNEALDQAKNKLKEIASDNGNNKYAYTVEANYLSEVFNSILGTITSDASITGATVKDYIDSRFVILDDLGNEITSNYPEIENGILLSNGGKVYYDNDGRQYIIWQDQGIGPENKANHTPGWVRKIAVKAQEDYLGGNDITTNGDNSGITVNNNTVSFPKPKVNVKAEFPITNKKITIYKGDSIPSDEEILKSLVDSNYIGKYVIELNNFTIERSTSNNFENENKVESFDGLKPEQTTKYYVRVSYNAGAPSKESNENTTLDNNVYHAGDENNIVYAKNDGKVHEVEQTTDNKNYKDKQYGVYDVDVKNGTLTIVKKVDNISSKDRTFTFKVKDESNVEQTVSVKVEANKKEGTDSLPGLARGTYSIEEVIPSGYEISNIEFIGSDTDSLNSKDGTTASIAFGTDKENNGVEGNNVINNYKYVGNGVQGKLEVTNRTVISNWNIVKVRKDNEKAVISGAEFALKQGNKVKYSGLSDEKGYIVWSKDNETDVTPVAGEYTLVETKAAEGYAKGDTTWTLKVTKGGNLEYIKDAKGNVIDPKGEEVNLYYFTNDVPYELPETGGIGIYWYTAGGMLLMLMAAIVVYRKRYNEYMNK